MKQGVTGKCARFGDVGLREFCRILYASRSHVRLTSTRSSNDARESERRGIQGERRNLSCRTRHCERAVSALFK